MADVLIGNKTNGKRTFEAIRKAILLCLSSGQHTINQISFKTRINWKTVELHLIYLIGRGLVNNIFSSQYVKIFELSEAGKEHVRSLNIQVIEQNNEELINKEIK